MSEPRCSKIDLRRGVVLAVVILCLAVVGIFFAAILKTAAAQREAVQTQLRQVEAAWLADSALGRAAARLAADPNYAGETWSLSAEQLGGNETAVVHIDVKPVEGHPNQRQVRAQADYPDHPHYRARETKQAVIELPMRTTGENS